MSPARDPVAASARARSATSSPASRTSRLRVGDTLTSRGRPAEPLPGYQDVKPMVFAGIFPTDSDEPEPGTRSSD